MKKGYFKGIREATNELNIKTVIYGCIMITVFCTVMFVVNLFTREYKTAIATGALAVWLIISVNVFNAYHKRLQILVAMMVGIYALSAFFLVTGGNDGFSVIWILVVPPAFLYCFNSYYGIPFILFLGVSLAVYMWSPLHKLGYTYSEAYLVKIPIAYFFTTIVCSVMQFRIYKYRKEQEELIANLESASQAKNDFLANMSHEIRTPMNAIVGMCELILRDDINENVRENCVNMQNSSRSLLAIINDILDFSKIESGRIDLVEDNFNIASTINDVINMAMTRKGDKDLEIIVRVDPTIPKGLIGDELRIRQIIINLLTNAIKYTKQGCVIVKITHSRRDYGVNLKVSVEDTGIGITKENIEKLFTSFQQVDTKKNRSEEGTGLGLAISKRLVNQMGGFINVESTYGKGSKFSFVIPLRVSNPEPFVQIKTDENLKIAVYLDMNKYRHPRIKEEYLKLITELGEKLDLQYVLMESFEKLQQEISTGEYSHCFTAKEEYAEHGDWINDNADKCQMVVIHDRFEIVDFPPNIKTVLNPFYALSFAAAINNEKFAMDARTGRNAGIRFVAPNAKILIVDDNVVNLKVAAGLMEPYNMKIFMVTSGPEAINAVQNKDYDLVFMDHMMPEMDGVEATEIIRNMDGDYFKKLPIIALTANAVSGAKEMFLSKGFNDFIAKPIEMAMLDRVLRTWLPYEKVIKNTTMVKEPEKVIEKVVEKTPEPEMSEPTQLIDYDKGIMYSGGSKSIYLEVLEMYYTSSGKSRESLDTSFADNDWNNYTVYIHSLKSTSSTIGAKELSEHAKKLEMASREGRYEEIINEHAQVMKQYEEVLGVVESYLRENGKLEDATEDSDSQEIKDLSVEEFMGYTERIIEAGENFDGDEMIILSQELCGFKVNQIRLDSYFTEVKKLAADYDYEQAAAVIQQAIEAVKEGKV